MSKHQHGDNERRERAERKPQQPHDPQIRQTHGGMPRRPDDDALARRTDAERAAAGLTGSGGGKGASRRRATRAERTEVDREITEGELTPDQLEARRDRGPYPPTRYGRR